MTNTNTASGAADDSLLLCASDLQHSAIYDNHVEMQACIRAVANRIAALASAAAQPQQGVQWQCGPQASGFTAPSVLEDAARWQALPAFFEEYQIDAMKLYRDIDAYLDAARKQGANHE